MCYFAFETALLSHWLWMLSSVAWQPSEVMFWWCCTKSDQSGDYRQWRGWIRASVDFIFSFNLFHQELVKKWNTYNCKNAILSPIIKQANNRLVMPIALSSMFTKANDIYACIFFWLVNYCPKSCLNSNRD